MPSPVDRPFEEEPDWPAASPGQRVLFLLDASTGLEERVLRAWIERNRPEGEADAFDVLCIPGTRRPGRRKTLDPRLEDDLATGDDLLVAPLRVIWRAKERDGRYRVQPLDVLKWGDPRDPDAMRERWVLWRRRERLRIVAAEPATASELRTRWRDSTSSDAGTLLGLPQFVSRQAHLALDRAERRLRGNRYKVPRFVHEDILTRPAFRGHMAKLARELGESEARVSRRAAKCLREIAASHRPVVIDLVVQLWNFMIRRSYDVVYDEREIEGLRRLAAQHPVVYLPSHKSNLDHPSLQWVLHENGFPPNHTAGGINMNFFPMGPLMRRSGVFFIRRTFKDDTVYKAVLQHYLDYLIEKRFPLEWYIEGGRSRSGKLLPPRFGLLAYVVDAYRRGKSDDVQLVPVSIAYDQISDVGDYAAEQRGGDKERESFGWFLRVLRRLRQRYGSVQVCFGEPVSLAKQLGPPDPQAEPDPDTTNLALQKIAFEVCVRINHATPVTAISLVCLVLLGRGDRAMSVGEMVQSLHNLVTYAVRRRLPGSEELDLTDPDGVKRTLDLLTSSDLLTRYDEGPEPVYAIGPDQHLSAAYYRNSVIHYFVNGAISELALLHAHETDEPDRKHAFYEEAFRLRDLLKFDFFFEEKDAFRAQIDRELSLHAPDWQARVARGPDGILSLFPRIRPLSAHRIVRPFLEAYRVVAEVLERLEPEAPFDNALVLKQSLAMGHQYLLQRHIQRAESVSQALFSTALKLAANRDLLGPGGDELRQQRQAFAEEIRDAIRHTDAVEAMVRARHAGLLDMRGSSDEPSGETPQAAAGF